MRRYAQCIAILLFAPICGEATVVGDVKIPERRGELELLGAGVLTKGFFFKVYAGALYVADIDDERINLSETAKRLDVYYLRDIPRKYMIWAAERTLGDNLEADELARFQPAIQRLHQSYLDGRKGAVASIIHHPEKGLTYLYNDKELLTIADEGFANAYFSIWLGERPSSRTMKKELLGNHHESNLDG